MKKRQEKTKTTKSCGHRKVSEEETDAPWYAKAWNFINYTRVGSTIFLIIFAAGLLTILFRYSSNRREELERYGVNVEAVVFYSKYWHPKRGAYRHLKVYFYLNGKYEEQRVYIYSHNYAPIPKVAVGDTIYIRVVPGKTDNNAFLSKKIHRIP